MRRKLIIGSVVVVVLAALIVANLRSQRRNTKEVETGKVSRTEIVSIVEASGRLRPAVSVDLSSDVIGRVVAVGAEEGDAVRKGQLLVQVDPLQYELRVQSARTARDQAETRLRELKAQLRQAQDQFARDAELYREELLSESGYERSRTAVEIATEQVESARLQLDQSRNSLAEADDRLEKTRILAPMDGVLVRKQVEVGEVAIQGTLNNPGSLLMTIADLSSMETEIEVDETDVVHIDLGQEAEVELDAFPDRVFKGKVTEVARSADVQRAIAGQQQSADFKVIVTLEESDPAMRPGLSATASITTATREKALAIPIQALVVRQRSKQEEGGGSGKPKQDGPSEESAEVSGVAVAASTPSEEAEEEKVDTEGVFVVQDGAVQFRKVEVGIAGEKDFEVLSGLEAGEEIVVGNFKMLRNLKDGDRVKVKAEDKRKRSRRKES